MPVSATVRELKELVLVREDEFRYAEWKLEDARKRLRQAEAEEWAMEIEEAAQQNTQEAKGQSQGGHLTQPEVEPPETPKEPSKDPEPRTRRPLPQPIKPAEPTVQAQPQKITVNVLVDAAMRADAKYAAQVQAASSQSSCEQQQHQQTPEPDGSAFAAYNINEPPPPPPPEQTRSMCPIPCQCGEPCTRIERMLQEQKTNAYARTRLKHGNHTCSTCQLAWYRNKKELGIHGHHGKHRHPWSTGTPKG